ncbi:MAG: retroviral-like aspartic protease family protein [Azospirillaceae bacterium]|nr:retroviral-like aspartic protease family protein [Azospirillaceae bacterium]
MLAGTVNGQPVYWLMDTGSTASFIVRPAAERLGLDIQGMSGDVEFSGIGGDGIRVGQTTLRHLTLGSWSRDDTAVMVANAHDLGRKDVIGLLGEPFFSDFDVELDYAHSQVILLKAVNCDDETWLAYWDKDAVDVPLDRSPAWNERVVVDVKVNGLLIQAMLDTGASTSALSFEGAQRAGLHIGDTGVNMTGPTGGLGAHAMHTYVGTLDSFAIGGETIKHAKLEFIDMHKWDPKLVRGSGYDYRLPQFDMLLGIDFLRVHRLLISHSQHRLYFSYIGDGKAFFGVTRPSQPAESPSAP